MLYQASGKFRSLYKSSFILSSSILVVSASMLGNAFAYLFQLVTARYFSPADYGTLVTLFSLSGIIPLALLFFTNGIPKLVAEIKDDDYPNRISSLFFAILRLALVVSIAVITLMVIFADPISSYLNIDNQLLMVIFAFAVGVGIINFMPFYLQGLMRFKAFSFVTILTALAKFGVALYVVQYALPLEDIFLGLLITTLVMITIELILLKKNIVNKWNESNTADIKLLLKYSFGGAFALLAITLIQHTDVILVKHFFTPEESGIFGSLVVVGRIVFFAASPIAAVMLPICSNKYKKGENYIAPFLITLGLAVAIGGSITFLYTFFPELIIHTLFGSKYLSASHYLPFYGIYMLIYTVMYMIATFLIAVSRFKLSALTLAAVFLQVIGINLYHANIYEVIYVSIGAVGLIVFIYLAILIPEYFRDHHSSAVK